MAAPRTAGREAAVLALSWQPLAAVVSFSSPGHSSRHVCQGLSGQVQHGHQGVGQVRERRACSAHQGTQISLKLGWLTAFSGLGQPTWGGGRGVQPEKGPRGAGKGELDVFWGWRWRGGLIYLPGCLLDILVSLRESVIQSARIDCRLFKVSWRMQKWRKTGSLPYQELWVPWERLDGAQRTTTIREEVSSDYHWQETQMEGEVREDKAHVVRTVSVQFCKWRYHLGDFGASVL